MKETSLKKLRDKLQEKDKTIIKLLNERAEISSEVGKIKNEQGLDIYDPLQENKVHNYLLELNEGPLSDDALKNIFREIISTSRAMQTPTTVAYFGPEASFTHLAAQSHFGKSVSFSPQSTIADVFDEVEMERIDYGVVPAENSSEGSVNVTMDRLISTPLNIRAEVFLRINHFLISTRKEIDGIKRVYSHPQALAQCQHWLRKNLLHCSLCEVESTAAATQRVLEDKEGAAIGSNLAASTYGLMIIAEGIEDSSSNTTRFLIIGKGKNEPSGKDKTSILFGTPHAPGALHDALEPFAREHINLVKIESHPVKDRMWEYLFFVDFDGHLEDDKIKKCLKDLKGLTSFVKILGSYPRGEVTAQL
jgi:chorismate mutase/prephenate dehydratase